MRFAFGWPRQRAAGLRLVFETCGRNSVVVSASLTEIRTILRLAGNTVRTRPLSEACLHDHHRHQPAAGAPQSRPAPRGRYSIKKFRELKDEIARLLASEATADFPLEKTIVPC
jgi:hypothetical protein